MSPTKSKGICFVLSSPSAAGKTSVAKQLLAKDAGIEKTISHTTRSPRPSEKNGVDYYFVDQTQFDHMISCDEFLEWAHVFDRKYGTSKQEIQNILDRGKDVLLVIEHQGAKALATLFPQSVRILLLPPSLRELEERMKGRPRAQSDDHALRLREAQQDVRSMSDYDYVIINHQIETAVEDLRAIVRSQRLRLTRNQDLIENFLQSS
ncbi:MAG: guanylate kinase [Bdellovibrionota bacterium]